MKADTTLKWVARWERCTPRWMHKHTPWEAAMVAVAALAALALALALPGMAKTHAVWPILCAVEMLRAARWQRITVDLAAWIVHGCPGGAAALEDETRGVLASVLEMKTDIEAAGGVDAIEQFLHDQEGPQ